MPEELAGGVANAGRVWRAGDIVVRPAPANAGTIHALLGHLASNRVPVPRPVGLLPDGMEAVAFIPGETSLPPYREEWIRSPHVVSEVGWALRSFHEATRDFVAPRDAFWSLELADPAGGPVICHNDVCIENVVFEDGQLVGLLDFDFAAPGRPIWDLAMTARYWAPLLDPESRSGTGREGLDPFDRLQVLIDAYDAGEADRSSFVEVLFEIEEVALAFVMARVGRGEEAFIEMWHGYGGYERHRRKMGWLEANRARLSDAASG